jgi:energy-coupling factor transporter ATP-binding protein EcfA2
VAGAVEMVGLSVTRGGVPVIRDVSLSIPAGSVTGLLGPSGCGKTTLMRAIVGVQRVATGDRNTLAPVLRAVSWALPLTYAYDALDRAAGLGALGGPLVRDVAVIGGATVMALCLGAWTLRRCTP